MLFFSRDGQENITKVQNILLNNRLWGLSNFITNPKISETQLEIAIN